MIKQENTILLTRIGNYLFIIWTPAYKFVSNVFSYEGDGLVAVYVLPFAYYAL